MEHPLAVQHLDTVRCQLSGFFLGGTRSSVCGWHPTTSQMTTGEPSHQRQTDLYLGVELTGTMKPEVMNFLSPVSGFKTLYAIKKHFALRGAVAQQLLMNKLRKHTYRSSGNGREWSRNFTTLVSRLTAAGLVLDETLQRSIFFENVEDSMPEWVDRIRDRLRGPIVPTMVEVHEDFINATVSRQHRQAKARKSNSGNGGSHVSHGKKKDGKKSHNQETTQGKGSSGSSGSSGGKSKEVKRSKDGSIIRVDVMTPSDLRFLSHPIRLAGFRWFPSPRLALRRRPWRRWCCGILTAMCP